LRRPTADPVEMKFHVTQVTDRYSSVGFLSNNVRGVVNLRHFFVTKSGNARRRLHGGRHLGKAGDEDACSRDGFRFLMLRYSSGAARRIHQMSLPSPIRTARLEIRRFDDGDLRDYLAYQTTPEVLRFMPNEPMTESEAIKFIEGQMGLVEGAKGHYHAFAVVHSEDRKVIGDVGFYFPPGGVNSGDMGFQFHPAYHGKGYASEAAAALLRYGFLQLGLSRITSGCNAGNTPSFRLLERLGMRREGHLVHSRITKGITHDEFLYAMLQEEFLKGLAWDYFRETTGRVGSCLHAGMEFVSGEADGKYLEISLHGGDVSEEYSVRDWKLRYDIETHRFFQTADQLRDNRQAITLKHSSTT
jgi:RimJ/RimL family protein N-acetyltransferase